VAETLDKGSEYRVRYRVRLHDGGERHISARGAVEIEGGKPARFLGTVQDRSDEEYAEHERSLFLAALGHDLRGPLAAIKLAADNLLRHAALPEPVHNTVARIARSSERMARLIEQLLDFARARAGRAMVLTPQPVELGELWHHILDEAALGEPGRRISLVSSGDTFGAWDPDRMTQVFHNLLWNAVQYGEHGRPITIRLIGNGEQVACEVHNWGPPIPAAAIPTLFDPFRRGRQGGRGLGLGLYIARQIVAAHGGTIEVSSTEEAGTTFRVVVPRRPPG
jgi:signal transduction histidine kinase